MINQPSSTVFASFGNGTATVGSPSRTGRHCADNSGRPPRPFKAAYASGVAHDISARGVLSGNGGFAKNRRWPTGSHLSGANTLPRRHDWSARRRLFGLRRAGPRAAPVHRWRWRRLGRTGAIMAATTIQSGGTLCALATPSAFQPVFQPEGHAHLQQLAHAGGGHAPTFLKNHANRR